MTSTHSPSHRTQHTARATAFGAWAAALGLLLATAAVPAQAQTWEYKSYRKSGPTGQFSKDNFITGTISVEEKDGKPFFQLNAGPLDACLRGGVPATVVKTAETTVIEPQVTLAGCEQFRYIIRNDGSGGVREHRRGDQWVNGRFDHGLTPVK